MSEAFAKDVAQRIEELDRQQPPAAGLVTVAAGLRRYVVGLETMLERGGDDWEAAREQLVTIAALAQRGARDLGIESKGDVFLKIVPF